MVRTEDFDFARNIRQIETLKVGMLSAVCEVYELMQNAPDGSEALGEALSAVIGTAQLLAQRVGLPRQELEKRVARRIRDDGA
ncbi:MAG: MazG-like family protein [Eubacteriales bacterium]|nr:MazG-like family protein [Eubacteriales bacterium]